MKRTIFFFLVVLTMTQGWARKVKTLPQTLHNYPSGVIDEYHFRPGYVVVRGCVKDVPSNKYGTLSLVGEDMFLCKDFVETIKVDSTGRFCTSVLIPHSQFFNFGNLAWPFVAVGDTLDVTITGHPETGDETVVCAGTGVTGEVNRVWPRLDEQFFSGKTMKEPWKIKGRQDMLEWKKQALEEFRAVVCAIDADTIGLLDGCSDFTRDVLKSSLLARIPLLIGVACLRVRWAARDGQLGVPSERSVSVQEAWDFLHECESYILDNPCMIFAFDGKYLINKLEFGPLDTYLFLGNQLNRECSSSDPKPLTNYKGNFVLPAFYDSKMHRKMREHYQDRLLSVADYYQMASDSICSRYRLHNSFMMQICLLHAALNVEEETAEEQYLYTIAERFAGAIPLFTDKIVAHRAVDAYRKFVVSKEGHKPEVSLSPEGDALFNALLEKYKGNVIFMDLWGLGCGPCRAGMLHQRADVEYFKDKPVRFLYLCNEKDSPRDLSEEFMNSNGIKGEHIYLTEDEWNHLAKKFQFTGIPFSVLIDKAGNIVSRKNGVTRSMIETLLAQ